MADVRAISNPHRCYFSVRNDQVATSRLDLRKHLPEKGLYLCPLVVLSRPPNVSWPRVRPVSLVE